jgi:addiction module HigA family antidote
MWRLSIIIEAASKEAIATMEKFDPIPPGEILLEEFMRPHDLSQNKLARDLDVPVARINDIIHTRRSISADTALRLAAYFGTTAEFWLNLQTRYDLKVARRIAGEAISKAVRPRSQHAA